MANCKRCQAPIQWQREGTRWIALNHPERTLHACTAPRTCRACEQPIVWKEQDGKRQPFEPDGVTLHNNVCPRRDECGHCAQKVRWVLIDNKWLALNTTSPAELHWATCPKNPESARHIASRMARLSEEIQGLRAQLATYAGLEERHRRELAYRDVELQRLTRELSKATSKRKSG